MTKYLVRPPLAVVVIWASLLVILATGAYGAGAPAPRWELESVATPTPFSPTEPVNVYEFVPTDVGGPLAEGYVEIRVRLAPGVTALEQRNSHWECPEQLAGLEEFICGKFLEPSTESLPEDAERLQIYVGLAAGISGELVTEAEISGAGAPSLIRTFSNKAGPPQSVYSIDNFETRLFDRSGGTTVPAASHPGQFWTTLTAASVKPPGRALNAVEEAKNLVFDLPPGFIGNPTAANECPIATFQARYTNCPVGSYLGEVAIGGGGTVIQNDPVYNLAPEAGFPAELGIWEISLGKSIVAQAVLAHTAEGYVVRVQAPGLLRGVPQGPYYLSTKLLGNPVQAAGLGPGRAFFTAPSHCSGEPLQTQVHIDTWRNPASVPLADDGSPDFGSADFAQPQWHNSVAGSPGVTGCEGLIFHPSLKVTSSGAATDSPSGLDVDIAVPQNEDPEGLATPPLRDATVALPKGLVVDPSSADGLSGCTESQLAPDSTDPGSCPEASKIGTATLRTPLIDHQLEGSVYLGTPECAPCSNADAAGGKLLKLFIEITDPKTGVVVKLPGTVSADPGSGQLTATFTENPQLPFEELELHVKSGARAPLTNPSTCGEYTTTSDLMPWSAPQSGPDAKPQSRFKITSGPNGSSCPNGEAGLTNSPKFEAGTTVPLAGTYSPFVLKVSRENGSQRIGSLEATLPAGLVGRLAGIPYCPDAAIAAAGSKGGRAEQASPSCPLASEVGTVNVGAGSGNPFYIQGHVYVAGPYKGAPLSLEIITPAVAGPFDLDTVAVRTALYVNESTAQIHAVSDPIPSILAGIPLDVRSIALNMNKPEFTLNPTSCNAMAVLGSTTSTLGQTASLQNRFQVGGCKGLAFKPELKLAFTGQTKRTGFPAVKGVLTQPKGQNANLAGAQVILPKGMLIANAHINNPCTRVQFNSGKLPGEGCPAKSILGTAKVWTPLLEKPEEGNVYFRSNGGERELPDLAVALRGQIPLQLLGFVDSVGKKGTEVRRVRARFQSLPDAPVSRFELKLLGGKKGLLQNSKNLCKVSDKAKYALTGQNGAVYDTEPKVQVKCAKGGGAKGGGKKGGGKSGGGGKQT